MNGKQVSAQAWSDEFETYRTTDEAARQVEPLAVFVQRALARLAHAQQEQREAKSQEVEHGR